MKTFDWQIGEFHGEVQRESVQAALAAAFLDYLEHNPPLSQHMASLKIQVHDREYKAPEVVSEEMPEFIIYNHQCKGNAYVRALWDRGYRRNCHNNRPQLVDFILTDHANTTRIGWLKDFALCGTNKFFVYPHTARPNLVNDITPEFEGVTAHFVAAPGHVDVMRAYGYEKSLHVVGWSLCPIQPFRPREAPRKVLFAPIHERCAKIDKEANLKAFRRLVKLAEEGKIHLTVRYYKAEKGSGLAGSGLEEYRHPEIEYHQIENLEPDWEEIDQADVVVSHQTFAWMAVARGVPTVMFGSDIPAHLVPMRQPETYAQHWSSYRRMLAYPYDLTEAAPSRVMGMLRRAVQDDREIRDWKQRMIGEAFDDDAFVSALEGYL